MGGRRAAHRLPLSGYASPRIAAFTDVDNAPARRLLESPGFRLEGVLRRAMFRDGGWHDIAAYGVVREEGSPEQVAGLGSRR